MIDSVVQLVLLLFFLGMSLAYVKGVKDVSYLNFSCRKIIKASNILAISQALPSLHHPSRCSNCDSPHGRFSFFERWLLDCLLFQNLFFYRRLLAVRSFHLR